MIGLLRKTKRFIQAVSQIREIHALVSNDYKSPKFNLGQIQANLNKSRPFTSSLGDVEFQVFSQWGDDGIIQHLISNLIIENKTFIEFGVEDYKESNTRFLLLKNNWSGLVLDGSLQSINYIRNDRVSWAHDLYAKQAFVTKENINELLRNEFLAKGFNKNVGILSIDIDGNDYWVWKEITCINPTIVIVEYNSFFSDERAVSIPYMSDFVMDGNVQPYYWGASLKAFCFLAEEKGYYFIGCNSNGNNAYFVKKESVGPFKPLDVKDGYVRAKFRLNFMKNGDPMSWSDVGENLRGKTVVNVENNQMETL